jgi:hypothetical protein
MVHFNLETVSLLQTCHTFLLVCQVNARMARSNVFNNHAASSINTIEAHLEEMTGLNEKHHS